MKDLNVCIMNDSFPPTIDGVANCAFNYADILTQNNHNVVVATPKYPDVKDNYDFEVLRYASVDATKLIGYRAGIPYNPKVISELSQKNIDIIHTHCPAMSAVLGRTLRKNIRKPLIFTYHTKFDIEIRKAIDLHMIQEAIIKVMIDNISACDEVWVVSKGAGENMRSMGYEGDYIVMPNGVDFDKGRANEELIDDVVKKYHLDKNIPTYLFVGRMYWYKGLKIILDALKKKKEAGQKFQFLGVGSGRELEEIKQYSIDLGLQDECQFIGPIYDRNYLKAIFSASDLFLFPSTYDTNGIVVREAAASGLASVLIEGSCAAEDTEPMRNCLWIKENADSMAKLLIETGDNKELFRSLGDNAMNDLYMSWEDSVLNAYKRYEYVSEKFDPSDVSRFSFDPNEGMMSLVSSLSDIMTMNQKAVNVSKDVFGDLKGIVDMTGWRREEIDFYVSKMQEESFEDYLEKIAVQTKDILNK
ncbi:MAG: glycosyltransferase [Erysipelotrichaceae bacterium]|nr:glycosyltransferase [Erysipelotrichaceae bacterium]